MWGQAVGRTGLACAVVEMLAGEVEVELLQLKGLVGNRQRAALGDDLDRRAQVLKVGTVGHVVDRQLNVGSVEDGEDAVDHVDRRLAGAGRAHRVGWGLKCRPVERSLSPCKPRTFLAGVV